MPRCSSRSRTRIEALGNERFSHEGTYFNVADSLVIPATPQPCSATSSYVRSEVPPRKMWNVEVGKQLDLYRAKCAEHGPTPDIVWIHACHLDDDRDTALREARDWVMGFIYGNDAGLKRCSSGSA